MHFIRTICTELLIGVVFLSACVMQVGNPTSIPETELPKLTLCDSGVCWGNWPLALLTPEIVQEEIKQLPGYEGAELRELWTAADVVLYGWNPGSNRFVELVLRRGRPIVLAHSLNSGLVLDRVICKLGDPSHILVQRYPNPEQLLVSVQVIYAPYGLIVHAEPTEGQRTFDVSPGLRISAFTLASTHKLDELLAAALYPLTSPPKISVETAGIDLAKAVQPWRGYVNYEVK